MGTNGRTFMDYVIVGAYCAFFFSGFLLWHPQVSHMGFIDLRQGMAEVALPSSGETSR